MDEAINLDEIVPVSFVSHFHAITERPRKHQLYPMLKALLLQRIFSIPTDTLLIVFLKYSQELRDFCGFDVVPDASKFTRFKVLQDMGMTEVDCVVVELDVEHEKALNVALNKISGEWDNDKLALLIADLQGADFDVSLTGFEPAELDDLFKDDVKDSIKDDDFDVDFIKKQSTELTEFDENLARRWLKKITIYEDKYTVEFKSGVSVDIEG